jgi:murein DD-endopeptidase MepM/ murein hydrolase activator NlpD
MAVLPGAQARSTPEPSTSVAQYRGGIAESAQLATAESVQSLGGELIQRADEHRRQLDELRVIEAATALRQGELDLTFDPQHGYQNIRGGDVVKRPIVEEYGQKHKELSDRITSTLSPRQQEQFKRHSAGSGVNFQAQVMRHSMAESEKYGGDVYKADLLSRAATASASYKNQLITAQQINGVDEATNYRMQTLGVNEISPALRDEFVKGARGTVHTAVIDAALKAGDTEYADSYFKANGKDMTLAQSDAVKAQLQPATDFAKAKGIAAEAFQKNLADPKYNATADILEKSGTNNRVASAAHSLYQQFVQEKKLADTEAQGSVLNTFYSTPDRATMNSVIASKEFNALNDTQKAVVRHTMQTNVVADERAVKADIWAERSHAATEEAWKAAEARRAQDALNNDPAVIARVNAEFKDPNFRKKTPEYFLGLAPEIGIDYAKHLIAVQAKEDKEFNSFKMNRYEVDSVKTESIRKNKNYDKAINEMAELRGRQFYEQYGHAPSLEEQKNIMLEIVTQKVEVPGMIYGFNEKELYKLPPAQRDAYSKLIDAARNAGRPEPTGEQLAKAWEVIEKQQKTTGQKGATLGVPPVPPTPKVVPSTTGAPATGAGTATTTTAGTPAAAPEAVKAPEPTVTATAPTFALGGSAPSTGVAPGLGSGGGAAAPKLTPMPDAIVKNIEAAKTPAPVKATTPAPVATKAETKAPAANEVTATIKPPAPAKDGLVEKGNIDLKNRPIVEANDGTVSTVRSISVNIDKKEVLIPTVIDGEIVSDKAAIAHYKKTGEHLGKFETVEAANAYAEKLHKTEEARVAEVRKAYGISEKPSTEKPKPAAVAQAEVAKAEAVKAETAKAEAAKVKADTEARAATKAAAEAKAKAEAAAAQAAKDEATKAEKAKAAATAKAAAEAKAAADAATAERKAAAAKIDKTRAAEKAAADALTAEIEAKNKAEVAKPKPETIISAASPVPKVEVKELEKEAQVFKKAITEKADEAGSSDTAKAIAEKAALGAAKEKQMIDEGTIKGGGTILQPQKTAGATKQKPISFSAAKRVSGEATYQLHEGTSHKHGYVSINAQPGEDVRAIQGGVVIFAGQANRSHGNVVMVKHTDGTTAVYGNNSETLVKAGKLVNKGEHIGVTEGGETRFELVHTGKDGRTVWDDPRPMMGMSAPKPAPKAKGKK